jgi:hypothetical protein
MADKFLFARQAHEVVADHLECTFCWLTSGPEVNQETCDDGTVTLNFDSILAITDEVRTAKELLEESKKYFNDPSLRIDQSNDLRRDGSLVVIPTTVVTQVLR